jgi:F-type H+-transporting ATPase subunit b
VRLFLFLTTGPFSPDDIINKLVPDGIWPIVTQLIATLVVVLIVHKLLYKPVKNLLDKRASHVETNISEAEKNKKESLQLREEAEQKAHAAMTEAQRLLKSAQEDIEITKTKMLNEAQTTSRNIRLKAEQDIEAAKEQAKDDIRKEIVNVALEASRSVLERELTDNDHEKIIDEFIKGGRH